MDPRPCRICGEAARHWQNVDDINHQLAENAFPVYRCDACRGYFVDPLPTDLGSYYPATYHEIPLDIQQFRQGLHRERYKREIILRHASGGDLLELGPSFCEALYLAKEAGFRVHGLEMNERCCRFAQKVLGIPDVRCSAHPVNDLPRVPTYDVIMLWHVLEHLPDPWSAVSAMAAALRPGGILILAMPNPEALQMSLLGRHWVHLDVPRHAMLIPVAALTDRLKAEGLSPAEITWTDPGSLGWNRFGWVRSMKRHGRNPVTRFLLRVAARATEIILMPLERTGRRGSAYTAVFRKPRA